MAQTDSTVPKGSDSSPVEGGERVEASAIRGGDSIWTGGRWEPVVDEPTTAPDDVWGTVVSVPTTRDGGPRTREFRVDEQVTVRRGGGDGGLVEVAEAGAATRALVVGDRVEVIESPYTRALERAGTPIIGRQGVVTELRPDGWHEIDVMDFRRRSFPGSVLRLVDDPVELTAPGAAAVDACEGEEPATTPAQIFAVRYPATPVDVDAALRALGSTGAGVAAALELGGYQGVKEDCYVCPVAEYVHAVVDGATRVYVDDLKVRVYAGPGHVEVPTPPQVMAFTKAFDAGKHPTLERPAVDGDRVEGDD